MKIELNVHCKISSAGGTPTRNQSKITPKDVVIFAVKAIKIIYLAAKFCDFIGFITKSFGG